MQDITKTQKTDKKPKEAVKPKQKKPKAKKNQTQQLVAKNIEDTIKSKNGAKKSDRKDTFEVKNSHATKS